MGPLALRNPGRVGNTDKEVERLRVMVKEARDAATDANERRVAAEERLFEHAAEVEMHLAHQERDRERERRSQPHSVIIIVAIFPHSCC